MTDEEQEKKLETLRVKAPKLAAFIGSQLADDGLEEMLLEVEGLVRETRALECVAIFHDAHEDANSDWAFARAEAIRKGNM